MSNIDMGEMVQDLRLLRPALQEDVLVVKDPLHTVVANRTLLQQCLSNLFDNALKFMTPGTKPRITLWTEKVKASETQPWQVQSTVMNPSGYSNEQGTNVTAVANTRSTRLPRMLS